MTLGTSLLSDPLSSMTFTMQAKTNTVGFLNHNNRLVQHPHAGVGGHSPKQIGSRSPSKVYQRTSAELSIDFAEDDVD